MRENTLKQKLEAGKAVFGVMLTFPSAQVVEMLGGLGFDWILIDNEHGTVTIENSEDLIRAAELSGVAPIVRPVSNKPEIIAPFMDRGAWGVQVPHVNTADEARAAVDAVKYHPLGRWHDIIVDDDSHTLAMTGHSPALRYPTDPIWLADLARITPKRGLGYRLR